MVKNRVINGAEEIALVTPTPAYLSIPNPSLGNLRRNIYPQYFLCILVIGHGRFNEMKPPFFQQQRQHLCDDSKLFLSIECQNKQAVLIERKD